MAGPAALAAGVEDLLELAMRNRVAVDVAVEALESVVRRVVELDLERRAVSPASWQSPQTELSMGSYSSVS